MLLAYLYSKRTIPLPMNAPRYLVVTLTGSNDTYPIIGIPTATSFFLSPTAGGQAYCCSIHPYPHAPLRARTLLLPHETHQKHKSPKNGNTDFEK